MPDDKAMSAAERKARRWYAQHISATGSWDDLPDQRRQQFIQTAGTKRYATCDMPF